MSDHIPHAMHINDYIGTVNIDCPDCASVVEAIREIVRDEIAVERVENGCDCRG